MDLVDDLGATAIRENGYIRTGHWREFEEYLLADDEFFEMDVKFTFCEFFFVCDKHIYIVSVDSSTFIILGTGLNICFLPSLLIVYYIIC